MVGGGFSAQVEVRQPVLAVLEGLQAVDDEWFGEVFGVVEASVDQALASETFDLALDRRGGDTELAGDLVANGPGAAY